MQMRPIEFKEQNLVLLKKIDYDQWPVMEDRGTIPEVVSCWKFTDEEIEQLKANGGKLYISQLVRKERVATMMLHLHIPEYLNLSDASEKGE